MRKHEMTQTFSLFVLITGCPGELAHHVKIGNRLIVLRREPPDAASSLIYWEELHVIQSGRDPTARLNGLGIKCNGLLVRIHLAGFVSRPHEVHKRSLPGFAKSTVICQQFRLRLCRLWKALLQSACNLLVIVCSCAFQE